MLGACRLLDATLPNSASPAPGAWSRGSAVSTCTAFGCRAGRFASSLGSRRPALPVCGTSLWRIWFRSF